MRASDESRPHAPRAGRRRPHSRLEPDMQKRLIVIAAALAAAGAVLSAAAFAQASDA
ncbi:hypothetical protein BURMUCF2_0317, partial [Burkholderia multivorans CF2]